MPPQHTPIPPPTSYYGQTPHPENGHHPHPAHHENFSEFVSLVCQESAAQQHHAAAVGHQQHSAHHAGHSVHGAGAGVPAVGAPLSRSPYSGYAPPIPPVSSSSNRALARADGKPVKMVSTVCVATNWCFISVEIDPNQASPPPVSPHNNNNNNNSLQHDEQRARSMSQHVAQQQQQQTSPPMSSGNAEVGQDLTSRTEVMIIAVPHLLPHN